MLARIDELIKYRELLRNLVVRDLKVRYKNSVLGVLWSLLNPLLMMTVLTVVFTVMTPSDIPDFPVFVLCGLLPWNFFASSMTAATGSIVENASLVKKVYFPREVLPLSVVLSNMVNFLIAFVALFAMSIIFQVRITAWVLLMPLIVLIQVMFTSGMAFFLSTLNVFYRDTKIIVEVGMMAWFFVTPVFYPIHKLPPNYVLWGINVNVQRWLRIVNPMASLVAAYRDVLFWGRMIGPDFLFRTFVTALVILVGGYWVFSRYSRTFGEEV
ncbi:MAG: ABC transporter permease [Chloroflexota bacterium]|nr:ABC transporter permease [Chloroflexota bacterium]